MALGWQNHREVLRYHMEECRDRYLEISKAIAASQEAADKRLTRIETLFNRVLIGIASASVFTLLNLVLHLKGSALP